MSRELTTGERAAIRLLVVKSCANYCGHYRLCLPLDTGCYMLGKWWTGAYCKYFQSAVLPLDPVLEAALLGRDVPEAHVCPVCGRPFVPHGKRAYCSPPCQREADRRRARVRMRKMRSGGGA